LLCPLTEKKDKILSAHNQIDAGNFLSNVLTFWKHSSMFQNPLPTFNVPTYLIHVDRGAQVKYHNKALITNILCFEASQTSESMHDKHYP
jgi:hypothetical protein